MTTKKKSPKKPTHGGARPGSGVKKGTVFVSERKKQYAIGLLPSVAEPIIAKYGSLADALHTLHLPAG